MLLKEKSYCLACLTKLKVVSFFWFTMHVRQDLASGFTHATPSLAFWLRLSLSLREKSQPATEAYLFYGSHSGF